MKLTYKLMAAAVALAASAGAAQARIQDATGGDSEFVFSAWDANAGKGYTYDLEWAASLTSFIGADGGVAVTPTGVVTMTPTSGVFFDRALPGFAGFVSTVTAADVKWNLASFDSSGRKQALVTLQDPGTNLLKNGKIADMAGKLNNYAGAVNAFGTHTGADTSIDGWATTVAGDGTAYAGNATWLGQIGATCNFSGCDTTAGLDGQNDLYLFFQKSMSSLQTSGGLVQLSYSGNNVFSKVYLNSGDNLYHLQIAAVPEPSEYALMLAGLGLIGFMARRRMANRV